MTLPDFHKAWDKAYPDSKVSFGFNSVAGYTTGVVIQNTLAATSSLDQLDLRKAVFSLSGKLKTLDGAFELDKNGAQTGEVMPLGQLVPDGKGGLKFSVVYPPEAATGKPVYPAPAP
jgi:branched-chain amino acid transport system substrate-binding protein